MTAVNPGGVIPEVEEGKGQRNENKPADDRHRQNSDPKAHEEPENDYVDECQRSETKNFLPLIHPKPIQDQLDNDTLGNQEYTDPYEKEEQDIQDEVRYR